MGGETWVVDAFQRSVVFEVLRHLEGVGVVLRHAQRHGLDAATQGEGRNRIHDAAEQPPRLGERRDHRLRAGQRTAGHVAVTVQILRRALHRQINAHRRHRLIQGAGERVVDHGHDTGLLARRRHLSYVDAAQGRVNRRFEPDHLRLGADDPIEVRQVVERNEAPLDAELGHQVFDNVERAAVNGRAAENFVARLQQRQQRRRDGRHPGTEQERGFRAVHRGHLLLDRHDCRVLIPGVEIAVQFSFLVFDDVGHRVEHERARLVDGHGERGRRAGINAFAGVNELGSGLHVGSLATEDTEDTEKFFLKCLSGISQVDSVNSVFSVASTLDRD